MKNTNKILALLLSFVLIIGIFTGCTSKDVTIKDREGREVKMPSKIERIISTAPSNTEVLVALGLSKKLVAVDKYSSNIEGIDKNVEKIDFTNPDAEKIISLKPDILIASGHNKTESGQDPFKAIEEAGISVVYVPSSDSIEGIYKDIEFIADIMGEKPKGEEIVSGMKNQIEDIKKISSKITNKRKVYFEIGSQPNLFSFGNGTFLNEMIEIIGAENIFKNEKAWISPTDESVIKSNPDVILTNESYISDAVEQIKKRTPWKNVNAIKEGRVYLINGDASSRPSQNIIKALKEMAIAVYPEYYEI